MYHALLTNRYLTSRVIPLIAVAAVALCVALVIIVVSVMTGFLNMVKESGRKLIGDVVISYPITGIPHYEALMEEIRALPEAAAATPVVDGFGLLRMPYPSGPDKQTAEVHFWGVEPESFAAVTGYESTLQWTELSQPQREWLLGDLLQRHWKTILEMLDDEQRLDLLRRVMRLDAPDESEVPSDQELRVQLPHISEERWSLLIEFASDEPSVLQAALRAEQWQRLVALEPRLTEPRAILDEGMALRHGEKPGIVLGIAVAKTNERETDGKYSPRFGFWMPRFEVTLTTIPVREGVSGAEDAEHAVLQVVNEMVSGVYVIDESRVIVPLSVAQELLHLDQAELMDPEDPTRTLGIEPARATMVLVRAVDNVTPDQLRSVVVGAYDRFFERFMDDIAPPPSPMFISIKTWLQQQADFIGPVEKEREIMRTLFSLVYIVCAGLVLAIFWAIVYEKTRDIGILRSVGASRIGISWIFLRYGLVVGVLGAIAGLGLSYVVVKNINVIHETLGKPPLELALVLLSLAGLTAAYAMYRSRSGRLLPVVIGVLGAVVLATLGLLALWLWRIGGVLVWDPKVYYFTKIPNDIDLNSAYATMIGAVVFSLIGAFLPAAKAADTDPVAALRYE